MQNIKRISRWLSILFKIWAISLPLLTAYIIFFCLNNASAMIWLSIGSYSSSFMDGVVNLSQFSIQHRLLLFFVELMPVFFSMMICTKLSALFNLYAHEQLFEEKNIRLIRSISIYMLYSQLIQLIYQPLMTFVLSMNNPKGQRLIGLSINSFNFSMLLTSLIILIASWIVKEAYQLKSEAQLTI